MSEPVQPAFEGMEHLVPPARRAASAKELDAASKVRWSKYVSTKRAHCYACIELRMSGQDVEPRRAAWVRRQGAVEVLLCRQHAQRARDFPQA